ncbi:MAG: phosphate ABC transporter permease PstA [Culicoidibacterales bacterium]
MSRTQKRKLFDKLFAGILLSTLLICIAILVWLILGLIGPGLKYIIKPSFYLNNPSVLDPENSGILGPLIGTILLVFVAAIIIIPIGIGTALFLEEFINKNSTVYKTIDLSISNLAGVPAIIYGLLGASFFGLLNNSLKASLLAGGIILGVMIIPTVIVTAQESIKSVPTSLQEAAYGLGMTKWQVMKAVVIPYALPGMITGIILALSRAMGEAAPLIALGAATSANFIPNLTSRYAAMPLIIYSWTANPNQETFLPMASAAIIVLLFFLIILNSIAAYLRNKYSTRL